MRVLSRRLRLTGLALAALAMTAVAADVQAAWYQRDAAIMGTRVAVELWSEDPALAERAMQAVMDEMLRTDELMSHYKPDSQLSAVNAHAAERPVEVDATIIEVVARALEFSRLSGGAFDITYASVGYLYDYRAHQKPSDAQIEQALAGRGLPARAARSRGQHDPLHCAGRAHRPRRNRQGLRGRSLDRDPAHARHPPRDGQRRRRHAPARRPARRAVDRRRARSAQRRRARDAPAPGRRGGLDLGRLRALLRGRRRALPPHPGARHRQVRSRSAQRDDPRARTRPRPTGCRRPCSCSASVAASSWSSDCRASRP